MSMTHPAAILKSEIQRQLDETFAFVEASFENRTALHDVEHGILKKILEMGRLFLGQLLALHGSGDVGETVTLPSGDQWQKLDELHGRRYVSIFGPFHIERTVYGSREGQKHEFVPLDNRLQLPESDFSYLLQDWDQNLCVEEAFGQAGSVGAKILGLKQSVDSLEHMNQRMAVDAPTFLLNRPLPDPAGGSLVTTPQGKGRLWPPQAH